MKIYSSPFGIVADQSSNNPFSNNYLQIRIISFAFIILIVSSQFLFAQYEEFRNFPLNKITPEGWQRSFLLKQRNGLTGQLDTIAEPFNQGGWIGSKENLKGPLYKSINAKGEEVLAWGTYEATGNYYDGVLRCGLLLQDDFLLNKAKRQIYGAIAEASPEGVIGYRIPNRWPQNCFFHAFMGLYEATKDHTILDALERHYANDKYPLTYSRDIINIEQLVWLYQQTGKKAYLTRAVDLYEAQASRPEDRGVAKFDDLKSDERLDVHGCTFHYQLKLPIMLYMATGDRKYIDAVRNAYRKVDKFSMLASGAPSSEEGLSGTSSISATESCNTVDYMSACLYMLEATGEVEWADRIERAVLNAGLGAVTKDFDAYAYLTAPNQIVCQIGSCRSIIHEQTAMAYCQRTQPVCCAGNLPRMFPNYVGWQWLKGKGDALVKALYGPSSCVHEVGGKSVKLREEDMFPFSDAIKITVVEGSATFPLYLRIPTWAKNPKVELNGVKQDGVESGRFFVLNGEHKTGDVIMLEFPKEVRVKQTEMNGVVVDYGPLLFTLPIVSHTEKVRLHDVIWNNTPADSKDLYGYNMLPASEWRYVLALDEEHNNWIEVIHNPNPDPNNLWNPLNSPVEIRMYGLRMNRWELHYREFRTLNGATKMMPITPPVPPRGMMTMVPAICGKPERITLVPYGSTTLRLTVFPYWDFKDLHPGWLDLSY